MVQYTRRKLLVRVSRAVCLSISSLRSALPWHLNPCLLSPYRMAPHWSQKVLLGLKVYSNHVWSFWFCGQEGRVWRHACKFTHTQKKRKCEKGGRSEKVLFAQTGGL